MSARLALLAALLVAAAAAAEEPHFDAATVGGPGSHMPGELTLPAGRAPAAAVVVLHGCNGIGPHERLWTAELARWGYAALLVDSFRPRGVVEVCNHGRDMPPEAQARDAFAAAAYLRSRADLHLMRIGVSAFRMAAGRC